MKTTLKLLPKHLNELYFQPPVSLSEIIKNSELSSSLVLSAFDIPKKISTKPLPGLYAFWWIGDIKKLPATKKVTLTTPNKKTQVIEWDRKEVLSLNMDKFPLYIGKSTNLTKRLAMHLALGTQDWKKLDKFRKGHVNKRTTACQFRAGIEHLFDYPNREALENLFKNVGVSFVHIPNTKSGQGIKERFYLEDLAVGLFRPWFNVDSER